MDGDWLSRGEFTETALKQALAECYVPALRRDVVTAGLIRSVTVELDTEAPGAGIAGVPSRYRVRVVLSAPGTDEPVNAQVLAAVQNRLLGLPAISRAEVAMKPALFPILTGTLDRL